MPFNSSRLFLMEQTPKVEMEGYGGQRGPTDYDIMMSFFRGVGNFITASLIHLYRRRWLVIGTVVLGVLTGYLWHSRSTLEYQMTISTHNTLVNQADVHSLIDGLTKGLEKGDGLSDEILLVEHELVKDTTAYGGRENAMNYGTIRLFTKVERDGAEYTQWLRTQVNGDPFLQEKVLRVKQMSERTIADNQKLIAITEELLQKGLGGGVSSPGEGGKQAEGRGEPLSNQYLKALMKLRQENLQLGELMENREAFHILSPFGEPRRAHGLFFRIGLAWFFWLMVLGCFDVFVWTKRQALLRDTGV